TASSNSSTCDGTADPIVSPSDKSSTPNSNNCSQTRMTSSTATFPSNGQSNTVETYPVTLFPSCFAPSMTFFITGYVSAIVLLIFALLCDSLADMNTDAISIPASSACLNLFRLGQ